MEIKRRFEVNPMWRRVSVFMFVMFFVFLADAMLSDFVPGYLEGILGSPMAMGLVMSTSSIAGLILDLLFAQMLRNFGVAKMVALAFIGCIAFVGLLLFSTFWPWVLILVLAMVTWGLYYEFFGFSGQKFVVGIAAPTQRTAVWSVIETLRAIAYAIGPLALAGVVQFGERPSLVFIAGVLCLGFLLFGFMKTKYKPEREVDHTKITIWHEVKHWSSLFKHIWPMVVLGITLVLIDAIYWTTGTVINDQLAQQHPLGGFFITVYMISSMFVGVIFGQREIKQHKKKLAEIFTFLSGIVLIFMTLLHVWWWYLIIVFVSSILSALAWPLLDAVYTDLLSRMGRENIHMIGLKNASNSIAYMIGPIIAGAMATLVGNIESFVYMGWLLVGVATILLIFTPRKLKLPQSEIQNWG